MLVILTVYHYALLTGQREVKMAGYLPSFLGGYRYFEPMQSRFIKTQKNNETNI